MQPQHPEHQSLRGPLDVDRTPWQRGERCPSCEERAWFPPSLDHITPQIRDGAASLPKIHLTMYLVEEVISAMPSPDSVRASRIPSIFGFPVCHGRVSPPPVVLEMGMALSMIRTLRRELRQKENEANHYRDGIAALQHFITVKGWNLDDGIDLSATATDAVAPAGEQSEAQ